MTKTEKKRKSNKKQTRKNKSSSSSTSSSTSSSGLYSFQKQITIKFLEMLMMLKLFHWKTHSYATHNATDKLYSSLNEHVDTFIEVLLGKSGSRIDLTKTRTISLYDLDSQEKLKEKINYFKNYLVNLDNNKILTTKMSNSDLFGIRDDILADLNKFLYLLTLK
jgi:DNA-binding ferritin-like protein